MAGEAFAQARGLCRGVDPPADLAGGEPEDRRGGIHDARILGHDRLQGLGGRLANVQDRALRLRIQLLDLEPIEIGKKLPRSIIDGFGGAEFIEAGTKLGFGVVRSPGSA